MEGFIVCQEQFLREEYKEWSYTELEIDISEEEKVNVSEVKLTSTTVIYRPNMSKTSTLIVGISMIYHNVMWWCLFRSCLSLQKVKKHPTLP